MRRILAAVAVLALATLLAACSRAPAAVDVPLAFVPADTAYVYANIEPVPATLTEQWSKPLQDYWPALFGIYEAALRDAPPAALGDSRRLLLAVLGELKTHAGWARLREIGFKPDARAALYGVGLVPVLRVELADPAAFKAEIARIEANAGTKFTLAKTGDQEYWLFGAGPLTAVVAIEAAHLVITTLPAQASDALKRTLLGLTRPARSLADTDGLAALSKQYGYSRFGAGYVDFVALATRLSKPLAGSDDEFAQALGLPRLDVDAACQSEYVDIAHKFPRLAIGAEEMTAQRMRFAAQLEIEPALAQRIAQAIGAAPGSGAPAAGVVDIGIAMPVLALKDFWIAQADAIATAPHDCAALGGLHDAVAAARQKMDVTIPPPFSDLTGLRVVIDSFAAGASGSLPQVTGEMLLGTTNPAAAIGMAQLAIPALQKVTIRPDSQPVALPADLLPVKTPPLTLAMSTKGIALAAGTDQAGALGTLLGAPNASTALFLRMHFSGIVYRWMAQAFQTMKTALPAANQAPFEQQIALFGIYEKWLRANELEFTATPTGILMRQTIELNPQ